MENQKLDLKICESQADNYVVWRWQALNVLRANGLEETIAKEDSKGIKVDKALALLGSSLNQENQMLVCGCKSAYELWQRLEGIYEDKTTFEKQELLRRLHAYKISSPSEVVKGLSEIQSLASRLNVMGERASDDALTSVIMNSLPAVFDSFLIAFKLLAPETRTLKHLISNVSARSKEMNKPEESALYANPSQSRKQFGRP